MTRNAIQTSEHISLGALLTAAGGFLEAYSFLTRDEVLANCQSGNLVLTALFAVQGEWSLAASLVCARMRVWSPGSC